VDVLVTGGNGYVGHHLIPTLLDRGDAVRVLALPGEDVSWLEARDVVVHRGDICRPETLAAPMQGVEGVLNLAAMMHVWRPLRDYRAVNVTGTENVARAALAAGVRRLVHMSSSSVYGMAHRGPVDETFALAPFPDPYPVTKAEGDRLVQRMIADEGLPAVIIRPGTFFGRGDRLHFERIAARLQANRSIVVGRGDNLLPFVYVTDVVQGLLLGLDHPQAVGEAFNITTDAPISQLELLQAIASEIGAPPPRVHVPYRALYAAGYAAERLSALTHSTRQPPLTRLGVNVFGTSNRHSIDKARARLGYAPQVSLRDGVKLAAAPEPRELQSVGAAR
jgi:nucleoside-diphosphate-sugar epimerase